jgi:hypothetical protein
MYNKLGQRSYRCPCTTNWNKGHTGVHVQQTGAKIIQVSMYNKLMDTCMIFAPVCWYSCLIIGKPLWPSSCSICVIMLVSVFIKFSLIMYQTGAKIIQVSMYNKLEQRSYRCPSTTRWSKCHTGVHVHQTGTKVIQVSMNNKLHFLCSSSLYMDTCISFTPVCIHGHMYDRCSSLLYMDTCMTYTPVYCT